MSVETKGFMSPQLRMGTVAHNPDAKQARQKGGPSEEMKGLFDQLSSMIQKNMLKTMEEMTKKGGPTQDGLEQLDQQLKMLKTLEQMQQGGAPRVGTQHPRGEPERCGTPAANPRGEPERCGTPAGGPKGAQGAQGPAASGVDEKQLKTNDEKMKGISTEPLGPNDDLLPPEEKNMSVDDLKNLKQLDDKGNPTDKQKYGLMANLGNQEGMRDKLKSVVGDFDKDPKAFARGEAYLQKIKHMPNPDGSPRNPDVVTNGKLEGCTGSGDIRSGTEAAILKDSFKGGPGVPDSKAPNPPKAEDAYKWLNEQKTLAVPGERDKKYVVDGASAKGDAQVFFENVGENIKKGFEKIGDGFKKIGDGIKNFAEGAIKTIGGAFKTVGGALAFAFTGGKEDKLLKEGVDDVKNGGKQAWNAVDTTIKGVGEVAGGLASTAVAISPAGMVINHFTDNAASRLAGGVFEGMADTIVKGKNGVFNAIDAAARGDWVGVGKGLYDTANLALMFVPGAGAANAARNAGTQIGKEAAEQGVKNAGKDGVQDSVGKHFGQELVKSGGKDSAVDEAFNQYDISQGKGNETGAKEGGWTQDRWDDKAATA